MKWAKKQKTELKFTKGVRRRHIHAAEFGRNGTSYCRCPFFVQRGQDSVLSLTTKAEGDAGHLTQQAKHARQAVSASVGGIGGGGGLPSHLGRITSLHPVSSGSMAEFFDLDKSVYHTSQRGGRRWSYSASYIYHKIAAPGDRGYPQGAG